MTGRSQSSLRDLVLHSPGLRVGDKDVGGLEKFGGDKPLMFLPPTVRLRIMTLLCPVNG